MKIWDYKVIKKNECSFYWFHSITLKFSKTHEQSKEKCSKIESLGLILPFPNLICFIGTVWS